MFGSENLEEDEEESDDDSDDKEANSVVFDEEDGANFLNTMPRGMGS
jgi:hypothetical protein